MAAKRCTTIPEYIQAASPASRPHLLALYAILKRAAPRAQEAIKWNAPFFIDPRFVFAFSAHKSHVNFAPTPAGLEPFRKELEKYSTTQNYLQIRYDQPLPEALIRRIAKRRVRDVGKSIEDGFWA